MKATEILMSEHRVIEHFIDALETAAQRLDAGETLRPGFFIEAADFIKGFTDGCHHKKEEGVLYETMSQNGVPVSGGPIGVMLSEHEAGREYTRQLRAAAERLQAGDMTAREAVVASAFRYTRLLRQHIFKEDHILFPMADRFIPAEEQDAVAEWFERVEHAETGEGIHEKYLALSNRLVREASENIRTNS